ncbi:MAG: hypothetical protein HY225_02080 [Candidatus Vogelbacteria bacterium]|nr:hypothetical protein [Candidatus Vogelbacteria bacterium]
MKEKLRARKKETVSELPSESIFDSTPVFGEYQKDGDKKAKAAELEKHAKEIAEELHIRDLLGDQGQNTRDVEAEKQDQSSDTNFKGQETRGGVDLAKMHTLIDQSQELISWRDQTKERIKSLLKKKDDDSKEMLDLAKTELRLLRRELNKHQIQMEKVIDGKGADLEIGNPVQDVKTAMAREIVLPELDWIKLKIESGIEEVLPYVIVDLEVSKPISEMTQKEKEKIVDRALEPVFEMAKKRIFESMSEFARWEFRQTGTMIGQLINRRLRKLIPEILEFSAERTDKRVKNIIEQEEVEKLKRAEHEMEIKKSAARKETEAREAQDNAWMVEHELRKGKAEGLGGVYLGSSNNYIAPALVNQVFGNPKPVSSEQYVEDYPLIYTTVNFLHGWIDWKWAKRNEKLRLLLDQTRDFNYARRDFENFFGREVDNGFREMLERQTVLFYEECYGENGKEKDMKPQEFIRQLQDHMRAMIYGSEKRFFDQLAGRFDEAVSADIKLTHGFDKLLNMAVVRFLQLLTNLEIIEEYFKKNGFIFNFDKDGRIVEADPSTQSPEVIWPKI